MQIEHGTYNRISTVTIREGSTNKLELTVDRESGAIMLYHAYREDTLSSTWYHEPVVTGVLSKEGWEIDV